MGDRRLSWVWIVAVVGITAAPAAAGERLAVLEFFGRPAGAYCSAAGPTMLALQEELAGRAVLLEYAYDDFPSGRVERFRIAEPQPLALPLVMVGSGYRTAWGSVDYERVYRGMLDAELARPATADVVAYWRREGNLARVFVTARNRSGRSLLVSEKAAVWVVAWEHSSEGVGSTWVRATEQWPLPHDLADQATVSAVVDIGPLSVAAWPYMEVLAFVEDRHPIHGRYDMLGAAEAQAPALTVAPETVLFSRARSSEQLTLAGPHVLEWRATSDAVWLELEPASGGLPCTVTLRMRPELRPVGKYSGQVTITATGYGMVFSETVEVAVGSPVRRVLGTRHP